jgi:hypothetical protein
MASPGSRFDFASDDPPGHYFYLPQTARPPRARTQWLAFRLRLHRFVAHTPASHFAIVLRARLGFDASGRAVSISGRGMTFGDTSQAQPVAGNPYAQAAGFGGARGAQVESFWPGGNFLYQDASVLPAGIEDDVDYTIELRVDDERRIELGVTAAGGAPQRTRIQDRAEHPVIADATGVLIGVGRGPVEAGPWRAELRDILTGWN